MYPILAATFVKGSLLLSAAWLVTVIMRRGSAGARHLVWSGVWVALAIMPLFEVVLPDLRVKVPAQTVSFANEVAEVVVPRVTEPIRPASPMETAAPRRRPIPIGTWITSLWLAGVLILLGRLATGHLAIRRQCQDARPFHDRDLVAHLAASLGMQNRFTVVESQCAVPMSSGVFHPVVQMPRASVEWNEDQRTMALLHELAHIRRGDLPMQAFANIVFSFYWWNPLAWFASRAFVRERECATDDLVLHAGTCASDYAGFLLTVAGTINPRGLPGGTVVSMAQPGQLEGRLVSILASGVSRWKPGRMSILFSLFLAAFVAIPIAALKAEPQRAIRRVVEAVLPPQATEIPVPLPVKPSARQKPTVIAQAQVVTPTAAAPVEAAPSAAVQPAFDVASVKPYSSNNSGGGGSGGTNRDAPGRYSSRGLNLQHLLMNAYGLPADQISGPVWIDTDRFAIEATVPAGATSQDIPLMLRKLLVDRFQLKIRMEDKSFTVYELVTATGGPKLTPATPAPDGTEIRELSRSLDAQGCPMLAPGHSSQGTWGPGIKCSAFRGATISQFIRTLGTLVSAEEGGMFSDTAHIVDKTGLTGEYDFTLRSSFNPRFPGSVQPQSDPDGLSIFVAVEQQLGLKLVKTKMPLEVLVIDHAERIPTEN